MNRNLSLVIAIAGTLGVAPVALGQSDPQRITPVAAPIFTLSHEEMIEVMVEPTSHATVPPSPTLPDEELLGDSGAMLIEGPQYGTRYCRSAGSLPSNATACGTCLCRNPACSTCRPHSCATDSYAHRIKSILQECHWGYCNHFDERPLGDAVFTTLSRQVDRGTMNMMTLYQYDFYPEGSAKAAELTPLGHRQLQKILERMQTVPAPIVVEITADKPALDNQRRQHVVQSLARLGVPTSEEFVILGTEEYGARAVEAAATYQNFMDSIRARGRTIRVVGSARFGGE